MGDLQFITLNRVFFHLAHTGIPILKEPWMSIKMPVILLLMGTIPRRMSKKPFCRSAQK